MKIFIVLTSLIIMGCSAKMTDYATRDCDINFDGQCYFKKRISIEKDNGPNVYVGKNPCWMITASEGCINPPN